MWKTHKILLTFILLPFLLVAMTHLSKEEENKIQVAVYIEEDREAAEESNREGNAEESGAGVFSEELRKRLEAREGSLKFVFYDSEEAVQQEVAAARAECGYCIPADLLQCIGRGKYTEIIKSYESPQSSLQTICEEVLFSEIFSLYEEATFGEQAAELVAGELEKNGQNGEARETLTKRAEELLEKYKNNGSTFRFAYETYSEEATEESENTQGSGGILPVRGILALAIYICGLCGTLDALEDEKKGRTVRLKGKRIFQLLTIYMPVFIMSVLTWFSLSIIGEMGEIAEELLRLLFYQFLMMVYCLVLKFICKKEERLAAAMPMLILCSVIVCPVFIDLSQFVPIFDVLKKAFPISYYLG